MLNGIRPQLKKQYHLAPTSRVVIMLNSGINIVNLYELKVNVILYHLHKIFRAVGRHFTHSHLHMSCLSMLMIPICFQKILIFSSLINFLI